MFHKRQSGVRPALVAALAAVATWLLPWPPALAAVAAARPFTVGPVETVATHAEIAAVFDPLTSAWPDSSIGVIRVDNQNPAHYWFLATSADQFGTPAFVKGTLADIFADPHGHNPVYPITPVHDAAPPYHQTACYSASDPCTYTYAGSGSIFVDRSGLFIQFAHLEHLFYIDNAHQPFYSVIGTDVSTDGGRTWSFLGETMTPRVSYANWLRYMQNNPQSLTDDEDIGPANYAIVTIRGVEYFYVYFNEYRYPITSSLYLAVARAKVADVVAAASASTPHAVAWHKFDRSAWQQPGILGTSSAVNPGNPQAWWMGVDVKYDRYAHRFISAMANNSGLYLAESPDAVTWSRPFYVGPATNGNEQLTTFPTIVGIDADPTVPGQAFYVYAIRRYEKVALRTLTRRLITLN